MSGFVVWIDVKLKSENENPSDVSQGLEHSCAGLLNTSTKPLLFHTRVLDETLQRIDSKIPTEDMNDWMPPKCSTNQSLKFLSEFDVSFRAMICESD